MALISLIAFNLSFPKLSKILRLDVKWQLGHPTHHQFTIPSRSQKIYYWVKIFDWNACTNKMETRFLETKISFWNFKLDCYYICGQNLEKTWKKWHISWQIHEHKMNFKWTKNELNLAKNMSHNHSRLWTKNQPKYEPDSWTKLNGNDRQSRLFFPISGDHQYWPILFYCNRWPTTAMA